MIRPKVAQEAPYGVPVEEGKTYFWCACGLSANQPFCDGSHKGTSFRSLPFTAEQSGTVWMCGCKMTQNAPFCDGSHKTLPSVDTTEAL